MTSQVSLGPPPAGETLEARVDHTSTELSYHRKDTRMFILSSCQSLDKDGPQKDINFLYVHLTGRQSTCGTEDIFPLGENADATDWKLSYHVTKSKCPIKRAPVVLLTPS